MAEWIELYPRAADPNTPAEPPRFFLYRRVPGQPLAGLQWQASGPLSYEDPYYVKIGNPAQMKLLRGKIVRAFEASVTVRSGTETRGSDPENPGRYPLVMQLFGGNVGVPDPNNPQRRVPPKLEWKMQPHPTNPEYGWIGADLKQSVSFPDTSLPIGGFFDDPRLGDVDQTNAFWPGGQSEVPFKAYTQTGPGDTPRWGISAGSIRVLVDGLPKVTVDIPSSVPVDGIVKGSIRIRYPSGDPVVGLPLGIGGFGQVSHRTIGGTWGRDAFFNTDENGEAHFELRGEYASNTYVQIIIRGTANEWANWYDPPLSNYTHPIMVAAPPGQPQPEGDCYTIPADPGQPYIPSRVEQVPQAAWDAGANSEIELEDDVSLRFNMRRATGVVLGLANDRENVTDRARITHGFYFTSTANGRWQVQVMEAAKVATSARVYDEETLFEIRRVSGAVTYWVDGELAHSSRTPSAGQVSVSTALYATGDAAPPFVPEQPPLEGEWVDILSGEYTINLRDGWPELGLPVDYDVTGGGTWNGIRTIDYVPPAGKVITHVRVRGDMVVNAPLTGSGLAPPRLVLNEWQTYEQRIVNFEQTTPTVYSLDGEYELDNEMPLSGGLVLEITVECGYLHPDAKPVYLQLPQLELLLTDA